MIYRTHTFLPPHFQHVGPLLFLDNSALIIAPSISCACWSFLSAAPPNDLFLFQKSHSCRVLRLQVICNSLPPLHALLSIYYSNYSIFSPLFSSVGLGLQNDQCARRYLVVLCSTIVIKDMLHFPHPFPPHTRIFSHLVLQRLALV